jgi:hypothetical protein
MFSFVINDPFQESRFWITWPPTRSFCPDRSSSPEEADTTRATFQGASDVKLDEAVNRLLYSIGSAANAFVRLGPNSCDRDTHVFSKRMKPEFCLKNIATSVSALHSSVTKIHTRTRKSLWNQNVAKQVCVNCSYFIILFGLEKEQNVLINSSWQIFQLNKLINCFRFVSLLL